jgi:hypothetical protein
LVIDPNPRWPSNLFPFDPRHEKEQPKITKKQETQVKKAIEDQIWKEAAKVPDVPGLKPSLKPKDPPKITGKITSLFDD